MKVRSEHLEFMYKINNDGRKLIPCNEEPKTDKWFEVNRLSISNGTWVASGFGTYIVKLKDSFMSEHKAKEILANHQSWRLGNEDIEPTDPKKLTQAIDMILEMI